MLDEDQRYSLESEIDRAFPSLDKLDEELNRLKIADKSNIKKKKCNFFNIFCKKKKSSLFNNSSRVLLRKKTLKHREYFKDGYIFRIQLIQRYYEDEIYYYEFSVNIKYSELVKKNQFYKKFININEAKKYYSDMEGVFKHLTRRDLIERLFKEKKQEIGTYKSNL